MKLPLGAQIGRALRSLRAQVILSYLPLVIVPVVVIGSVAQGVAARGFDVLVRADARQYMDNVMPCLSAYYETFGAWTGLNGIFAGEGTSVVVVSERRLRPETGGGQPPVGHTLKESLALIITSGLPQCIVVIESGIRTAPPSQNPFGEGVGNPPYGGATPLPGGEGVALPVNPPMNPLPGMGEMGGGGQPPYRRGGGIGQPFALSPDALLILDTAGTIIATTPNAAPYIGRSLEDPNFLGAGIYVRGQLVGRVAVGMALGAMSEAQRETLGAISSGVLAAALISGLLALGFGVILSWRISTPLRHLMAGVRRLAAGEWNTPIERGARGEFGDLTDAFNGMAGEITRQQKLNRQMVGDIAHDLRTPLSVMMLEIEAIEAGYQTPTEAAAALREEVGWLSRMVDDLRLLSLMDADQITLQRENVPMGDFLRSIHDFWATAAESEGRTMRLDLPNALPTVDVDPSRLRQIISNLIDNALRHTRPGDAITLSGRVGEGAMIVAVSDEGEGIAPDALPHIFDRFYRADRSRQHHPDGWKRDGSGLGLSITKRLVELHQGAIHVQSTLGRGTIFTVHFPLT